MSQSFKRDVVACRLPLWHLYFLTSLLLLLATTVLAQERADSNQVVQDLRTLEPGTPIERDLAGGEIHAYQIALAVGQYLEVTVEQHGIELAVAILGPNGNQILEVESQPGGQAPVKVWGVADASGIHRLKIRTLKKKAAPGRYQIKIEALRDAISKDRSRSLAKQFFEQGLKLNRQESAESLHQAIKKYEDALPQWRAAEDRDGEGAACNNLGGIYIRIGEFQKAVTYFERTLSLIRDLPDMKNGVAATLINMGLAYNYLGETLKSLACYNEALQILRESDDDYGEAITLSNLGLLYQSIGELQKALEHYFQALPITRALNERYGEATVLNGIGAVYTRLRETDKALNYLTQALQRWKEVKNAEGEAATLNNFGYNYERQNETQKALDHFGQALQRWQEIGDPDGEAGTLINIGRLYDKMGQKQRALDSLNRAMTLYQKIKKTGRHRQCSHRHRQCALLA